MGSHLTAAATGTAVATAMPPVLADAAAAAVLAVSGCAAARACRGRRGRTLCLHLLRSRPCSQRQTGTTALLAPAAPTPVLADAATTAVLAVAALPPVLAHTHSRCCHRTPCTCCAAGRACRGHYRPLLTQGISPAHEDRAYLSGRMSCVPRCGILREVRPLLGLRRRASRCTATRSILNRLCWYTLPRVCRTRCQSSTTINGPCALLSSITDADSSFL